MKRFLRGPSAASDSWHILILLPALPCIDTACAQRPRNISSNQAPLGGGSSVIMSGLAVSNFGARPFDIPPQTSPERVCQQDNRTHSTGDKCYTTNKPQSENWAKFSCWGIAEQHPTNRDRRAFLSGACCSVQLLTCGVSGSSARSS